MPLHGKIVVIKRTGGDGTEFPLTATCIFGRKPDCDIRIQLPQVSKEHCRIDLNENKEIILTNLSSVNPTRVNGEPLDQPDRLKHGDVITIIDRSFRFESAPAPTPKKRLSSGRKSETLKVLKDQQAGDCVTAETGEKGISEVSTDPHLKDGANHENIQRTLEKTMEMEDDSLDVYGLPEVNLSLKGFPGNVTKMPLHGKIVVIKRTGGDGTEFPLTATCLFGRKPDCDICIKIPQVSKEHCRIDLNENKEIILTNLSSVNPTRVNGEPLDQPDRLKHGDVITIIDRSFRFESAPAPTPKKRLSSGRKSETLKVLKDQQAGDCVTAETGEKGISEVSTDPHLKDGANHENIQRTLEKTMEMEDDSLLQSKTNSPFGDLYQMIKKSLDVKTPRKSCASVLQTPTSRFCTPKPVGRPVVATEDKSTPKKVEADVSPAADVTKVEAEKTSGGTPKSVKKQRTSIQVPSTEMAAPKVEETETAPTSEATSPQKRIRTTPERFTAGEVIESPKRRRSKEATPTKPAVTEEKEGQAVTSPKTQRASPRNSVKETSKKRKSGEIVSDLPTPQMKRKRVSFGGHLNPELFDKRLPPDSPLRKGATPRRSLGQAASKQSLLRRASVIGVRQEFENDGSKKKSPAKGRTPSPKKTSPKTPTPAKKSPKSKSPSPKSKTPSPAKGGSPSVQTPSVQGRFSVSRISTPSPVADDDVFDQVPLVTPKLPLKRKSIQTPNLVKSAAKVMRRRSGISRASMKVTNTWAGIVKFGQTKAPVAAPAKQTVIKKTMKKAVAKPQTPARKLPGHVSTGHADSPVTIVVGRAHRQNVTLQTGAAPRLITNTAVLKKNMKMDEDLTGVCEIFKTPVNERNRRCFINEISAMKTPVGDLGMSLVEPSVLNTPEETGEMMVSPLTISSTVKDGRYNSEAVQRLLDDDQESSFVIDSPAMETLPEDFCEQQCADLKTTSVTTPKQKTPRQKSEPIDDLRGKILKTPKQKPEHQECLTGVKRIMKTPRQKAQPIEDLRGKILKTPKQKAEHQECLTGVKDLMKTPQQEAEDLPGKLMETPTVLKAVDASLDGVKEPVETTVQESENLCEKTDTITPIMETTAPVEDTVDVQELTEEPLSDPAGQLETNEVEDQTSADCDVIVAKELDFAQEESQVDVTPSDVIDVEMEKATETNEVVVVDDHSEEVSVGATVDENLPVEQPKVDAVEKNVSEDQPEAEIATCTEVETVATDLEQEVAVDQREATEHSEDPVVPDPQEMDPNEVIVVDHSEEVSVGADEAESSDAMETISQATVDENVPVEQPKVDTVEENVSEEQPEVEITPDHEKKPVRSRRAKVVEPEVAEDKEEAKEPSEDPVVPAPVRGRRGKKTEAVAPPAVKKTRGRNTKTTESNDVEPAEEKVALKPKRGRNAKKASDEAEMVQEVTIETETAPEPESEPSPPVEVHHESHDIAAPLEKAAPKPKRARKAKQAEESLPSEQDVPCVHSEDVPQADLAKEADANEAVEAVQQAPVVAEVEAVTKKPVRRGRAKVVETKAVEVKEEATEHSEDAVVPAPVRGRRGKKTEATAPPAAARQTKRGKNAMSEESTSEGQAEIVPEKAVETTPVTEETPEDIAPPAEEAVVKPVRGRKTKQTPEPVPQPEENELAEEVVTVETKQQSQPSVRARRGRNAKREEEKDAETIEPQEPVKKTRRTRKAEPDHVEAREEVHTVEIVTEEPEAPLVVEPVEVIEPVTVAAKPKRGGRKAKQDPGSETPVQSTEVQEVPAVSATEKPKRGGRGKRVIEEVVVVEEEPNHEVEAVAEKDAEEDAPVVKNSRARGAKTSVKKEVPQAIPAKRARRGAALPIEENKAESTAQVSESASVEPAKKGRRAAAAKPTANDATVTSDKAKPDADVEDAKVSKRAVRWRSGVEVFDIPKVTPAKAVRGKKSKLVDQADAESKKVSEDANKTGEMELSDEVVEVQPPKRARRGAKVPEVKADKAESTSTVASVEAETQPKSRKGRSAKK